MKDVEFFKRQTKIVLANCGRIDPLKIDDYIGREGYAGLARVLTGMKPDDVIDEMKKSGLRGRGGAGFSTGLNGVSPANRRATSNTCSATPTRATPARSWTAACSKATRTA